MKEVDQKTGEDLNPKEPSLPKDAVLPWEDAMYHNPEAPWANPAEESTSQIKTYVFFSQKLFRCFFICLYQQMF